MVAVEFDMGKTGLGKDILRRSLPGQVCSAPEASSKHVNFLCRHQGALEYFQQENDMFRDIL